jgi:hypothetical protein
MTAVTGEIEATKINAATIAVHVRRRMKLLPGDNSKLARK